MKSLSLDSTIGIALEEAAAALYGEQSTGKLEQRRLALFLIRVGCAAVIRQYQDFPALPGGYRQFPAVVEFREPTPDEQIAESVSARFAEYTCSPEIFDYWQRTVAKQIELDSEYKS